jgi:hypothetical protein
LGHPSHKCYQAYHKITGESLLYEDQMPPVGPQTPQGPEGKPPPVVNSTSTSTDQSKV